MKSSYLGKGHTTSFERALYAATGLNLTQIAASIVDGGSGTDKVVYSISELQNLTPLRAGDTIKLSFGDRSGDFQWLFGDLSSEVTVDTCMGVFIPPTSDLTGASGCWVREDALVNSDCMKGTWFGVEGGVESGPAINCAIKVAGIFGSQVVLPATTQPILFSENIVYLQGTKMKGGGFSKLYTSSTGLGTVLERSVGGVGIVIDGEAYGERLRWVSMVDINLGGGGLAGDLITVRKVQNLTVSGSVVYDTSGRSMWLRDIYDSWFRDSYFQSSGTQGTVPSFHLDDSLGSSTSHNNNIRFSGCTWEGNNSQPILIDGKGTGPGNSQVTFSNKCKCENLGVDDYLMKFIGCGSINIESMLLVSKGTSGQIPAQVYCEDVKNIRASFDIAHTAGGALLGSVVELNGYSRSNITLYPAEANVIDGLTSSYIFDNSKGSYDSLTELVCVYMGNKNLVNNNTTIDRMQPLGIDTPNAIGLRIRRNGGSSSNTCMQYDGAGSSDIFTGKNGNGEFLVSTSSDLDGSAIFKVNGDGVPLLGSTQLTVGNAGSASAVPATPSGYVEVEVGSGYVVIPYYNKQ